MKEKLKNKKIGEEFVKKKFDKKKIIDEIIGIL